MLEDMHQFQQIKKQLTQQLQLFSIEHGQYPTHNLEVNITSLPFLSLLKGQNNAIQKTPCLLPRIYWQNKQKTKTLACFGAIEQCYSPPKATEESLYIGGLAFQQQGEQWQDFPATLFVRPMIVFQALNQSPAIDYQAIFHFNGNNSVQQTIITINALQPPLPLLPFTAKQLSRQDSPCKIAWATLVELAIEYKALLPKVVLSRQTALCFDALIDSWDLMALWQQAEPNSYHYALQFSLHSTFISCSPETLYARHHQQVSTEALAGTVNRGRDQREDALLIQSLLNDKKIDRENHIVQEFIIANLKQLKAKVNCCAAEVLQLKNVQHLRVPIKALINKDTQDCELLYKLHPTPAVGGIPKLPALQFINDNEPYHRGWYAGAVGCISEHESEFSVAIRSALITENSIKLFAGAGIVTGSIADQEWQELENKIKTILTILGTQ
jgi:menaquinone-specific isochorismate synthase